MGTWGAGIFQNDTADDVRCDYKAKLKMGKSDEEALKEILDESKNYIFDDDDKYDFWFGLADITHDLGRLTDEVKNEALALIEGGGDLDRWEGSERKKRYKNLEKLKEKLLSEIPERKNIPVKKPFHCAWNKSDVFYFKTENDRLYRYALVLVEDLIPYDAEIEGLGDILPVTLIKLCEKIPENLSDIDNSPFLTCFFTPKKQNQLRFLLYKNNFRAFEKRLQYLGNFNFYVPGNKYIADSSDLYGYGIHPSNFENIIQRNLALNSDPNSVYYGRYLISNKTEENL